MSDQELWPPLARARHLGLLGGMNRDEMLKAEPVLAMLMTNALNKTLNKRPQWVPVVGQTVRWMPAFTEEQCPTADEALAQWFTERIESSSY